MTIWSRPSERDDTFAQNPWNTAEFALRRAPSVRRRTSKEGLEVAVEVPVPPRGALVPTVRGGLIGLEGRVVVQAGSRLVRHRELAAAALRVGLYSG